MQTPWLQSFQLALLLIVCSNTWAGTMKYYAVHTDQLGTPQVITNENKQVVWEADRDPFGKVTNVVTNNFAMNVALPGQYTDAETNYNQNWNRDYDPNTGRYLQSDPIGQRGGVNTYIYANANPVNNFDFNGLCVESNAWACAGLPPPPTDEEKKEQDCFVKCMVKGEAEDEGKEFFAEHYVEKKAGSMAAGAFKMLISPLKPLLLVKGARECNQQCSTCPEDKK